jgi:hypothetical protein
MNSIKATWTNGQILPSEPIVWPEGTELVIEPAMPHSPLSVGELDVFLRGLPPLGDDAEQFANDISAIRREFPAETNPWD